VDDFYIGYDPPMPRRLARFTRRITCAIALGSLATAVLLPRELMAIPRRSPAVSSRVPILT
jgi:hypothetical protein